MSLSTYLKSIADAIRERKSTSEIINAQNFADEIKNLPEKFSISMSDDSAGQPLTSVITSLPTIDFKNISFGIYTLGGLTLINELSVKNTESLVDITALFNGDSSLKKIQGLKTTNVKIMENTWGGCTSLKELSELEADSLENISNVFTGCSNLETFGGFKNLGKVFDREDSYEGNVHLNIIECISLTHDSLLNIINNLYNISIVTNADDLKGAILISEIQKEKLNDSEIAIATSKGWYVGTM